MRTSRHLVAVLLAVALLGPGCTKKEVQESEAPAVPVRFGKVTKGDITQVLELVGNVKPDRMAVIMSNVPGKVLKVYHRDGESVPEGEPLIELDPEEIELGMRQAKAGLSAAYATAAQARVQRDATKKEFDRVVELMQRDAISRSDYDKAEAMYEASRQAVRMAQANIRNAKALIGKAKMYHRDSVIKAPFAGEIAKLMIEEGERIYTMPPTPALVLIDYDRVKIECPVAERDVGSITEGMSVQVMLDAFPNVTLDATIDRVVPFLEAESRTFTIKVYLDNPDHRYKPGMMARVNVSATYHNVISVHRDAFSLNNITGDIRVVEIVDGLAVERMAVPGRSFGDRVEIRKLAGLKIGSIVITSGASDILDGQRVEPVMEGDVEVEPTAAKEDGEETQ